MTTWVEDFEGISDETSISTSNTVFSNAPSGGGTSVADTAQFKAGSVSARVEATASTRILRHDITAAGVVGFRWYMRVEDLPAANMNIAHIVNGANLVAAVRLNSAGTVSIRDNVTNVDTTALTVAADEWVRFWWEVDPGVGQTLKVYRGSSLEAATSAADNGTTVETITGSADGAAGPNTTADSFRFGVVTSSTLISWWDDVQLQDVAGEPSPTGTPPDTNAAAEAGSGSGSAYDPTAVSVSQASEAASGTGAAHDVLAVDVAQAAEAAAGVGAAQDAGVNVSVDSEAATGAGAAQDAGVNVSVDSEAATGVGAAYGVLTAALAGAVTGSGAAYDATVNASTGAQAATGAGSAPFEEGTLLSTELTALNPVNGLGEAFNATVVAVDLAFPECPTGSGAAYDATTTLVAFVNAAAECATGAGAADDPDAAPLAAPAPADAAGSGAAYDARPVVSAVDVDSGGLGVVSTWDAAGAVSPNALLALADAQALNALISTALNWQVSAQCALGAADFMDPTPSNTDDAPAELIDVVGVGWDAEPSVFASAGCATGVGAGYAVSPSTPTGNARYRPGVGPTMRRA